MSDADTPRAACLTPPAMGGVAVIQVVGRQAPRLVSPFIRSKRPIDLENLPPDQLRLCQWADGDQIIDDAIVAVRRTPAGQWVIDISLHGGPRIVQRSLLMLQRAGARLVDPVDLLVECSHAAGPIEREILPLLLRARTRAVAAWLAEMANRLPERVRELLDLLAAGDLDSARQELAQLCSAAALVPKLLDGVRVVVTGGPNTGKSTLVNALAAREHAIVSDLPGTTRDWVEHPGTIDGIPFVFVDTAGIRDTHDPVEQEAIRRACQQASTADILLTVFDLTVPAPSDPTVALSEDLTERTDRPPPPVIPVANKSDRPPHPSWETVSVQGTRPLRISALRLVGLEALQEAMVRSAGLAGWRGWLVAPLTERQQLACRAALSALRERPSDPRNAAGRLDELLDRPSSG